MVVCPLCSGKWNLTELESLGEYHLKIEKMRIRERESKADRGRERAKDRKREGDWLTGK